jgi:regulator of sigma E protease
MGPRIFSRTSKKTGITYSLALLPFGGFVAMAGENGECEEGEIEDPNSFSKKPAWQRFIITFAGAFINIVAGMLAITVFTCMINLGDTTVREFADKEKYGLEVSSEESGLRVGDEIIAVDGKSVSVYDHLSYEIMRRGNKPIDLTVIRDGKEIIIPDVVFPTMTDQEQTFGAMDFGVYRVEKTFGTVIKYSWYKSTLIIRMCWESIYDLITGRYSFAAVSGPVGISSAIGDAADVGPDMLLYIVALISINLGVMNLLPIPALDGGRLLTITIEMITRKKIPPKVEGIINAVGLALLLTLSFFVLIKDIVQLIF